MKRRIVLIAVFTLFFTMVYGQQQPTMYVLIKDYLPNHVKFQDVTGTVTPTGSCKLSDGSEIFVDSISTNFSSIGEDFVLEVKFSGTGGDVFDVVKTCIRISMNIPDIMVCSHAICDIEFVYSFVLDNWVNDMTTACLLCNTAEP
jgi:hypothetical protein